MSIGLVSSVGIVVGAVNAGFVYVGVSEITGSPAAGIVAAVAVTVAEIWAVRTVKRLMNENAAAAGVPNA